MKFTTPRPALAEALRKACAVVERRSTLPILSTVLLEARRGRLTLRATDLDMELVVMLDAEIETPGAVCLDAIRLHALARFAPEAETVELTKTQEGVTALAAGTVARFSALPAEDFPTMLAPEGKRYTVEASHLARLLTRALPFVSDEETRYYLNGVLLQAFEDGKMRRLRSVATCGHRLARVDSPLPEGMSFDDAIVPKKAALLMGRFLGACKDAAQVTIDGLRARVELPGLIFTTKLIDGSYPDYSKVIPKAFASSVTVEAPVLAAAIRRVTAVGGSEGRSKAMAFWAPEGGQSGKMRIAARGSDVAGEAVTEIAAESAGPEQVVGCNAPYLSGALRGLAGKVTIRIGKEDGPFCLVPEADGEMLMLVMPMRLGDGEKRLAAKPLGLTATAAPATPEPPLMKAAA